MTSVCCKLYVFTQDIPNICKGYGEVSFPIYFRLMGLLFAFSYFNIVKVMHKHY